MSAVGWECPPEVAWLFSRAEAKFEFDHPHPGDAQTVVVAERAGWQQVAEMHYCDRWEPLDGRDRCGLVFGDGHRCDVTLLVPGRASSTWAYMRPAPDRSPA